MSDLVTLHREEDGILVLTLNDDQGKNAFTEALIEQLVDSLDRLARDETARVGVLRGLPKIFCAGADQDLLLSLAEDSGGANDIILPRMALDVPIPLIAAMEGHAIGGGLALGLCCDIVLMARESRYGCSFMNLGFTPGMGTTRLLQRAVGDYTANEMMFGGQLFKGAQLSGRGTINYILPRDEVWPRALRIARRIAEKPRLSLELLKRYLSLPRRQAFEETRTVETMMHQLSFAQPDTARRIQENYALDPSRKK